MKLCLLKCNQSAFSKYINVSSVRRGQADNKTCYITIVTDEGLFCYPGDSKPHIAKWDEVNLKNDSIFKQNSNVGLVREILRAQST